MQLFLKQYMEDLPDELKTTFERDFSDPTQMFGEPTKKNPDVRKGRIVKQWHEGENGDMI